MQQALLEPLGLVPWRDAIIGSTARGRREYPFGHVGLDG